MRERDTFDMFQQPDRGRFGDKEQAPPQNGQTITETYRYAGQKPLALAICDPNGNPRKFIWLSKSLIEFEMKGAAEVSVTMPSWLAKEKRLI